MTDADPLLEPPTDSERLARAEEELVVLRAWAERELDNLLAKEAQVGDADEAADEEEEDHYVAPSGVPNGGSFSSPPEQADRAAPATVTLTPRATKQLQRLCAITGLPETDAVTKAVSLYLDIGMHRRDGQRKAAFVDLVTHEVQPLEIISASELREREAASGGTATGATRPGIDSAYDGSMQPGNLG